MNNPTIARLLAKENIVVQHGNYKTAWFDIKNRVLGLPLWKDMGKDVYDLFVGHEIGHALYTPYEGWHDSPEKIKGAPRTYINVVEDARIEKLSRRDYPGLVGPFLRGYKKLVEQDFFGPLDNLIWEEIKLIDKINLKAKLGNGITVPFNKEEQILFNKVMATQTFEEVVELCKEILAYTKENTPDLLTPPPPPPPADMEMPGEMEGEEEGPSGHDDYEQPEDPAGANTDSFGSPIDPDKDEDKQKSDSTDGDETDDREETNNSSSNGDDEDTPSVDDDSQIASPEPEDDPSQYERSATDDLQRASERKILDIDETGRQRQFARVPCQEIINDVLCDYETLTEERKATRERSGFNIEDSKILEGFEEYMNGVKKSARFAIKEFELHKAAYQWQRSATAKTGSLDMNKVHSYKFNEDIFLRVTKLANAKNHGMIMFIDYSGSMGRTMSQVVDQLMHLVVFCKGVNIPFDVYAFTTKDHGMSYEEARKLYRDGDIGLDRASIPLLISSSFKKAQYEDALKNLYMKKRASATTYDYYNEDYFSDYDFMGKSEDWGSTPLNIALVLAHDMVKKFKARHNIDKMNLIVLSDGDSNTLRAYDDYKNKDLQKNKIKTSFQSGMTVEIDRKLLTIRGNGRTATKALLENIQKRYNVNTLGFFVSENPYDWRSKLQEAETNSGDWKYVDLGAYNKEYRKNKCVSFKNTIGYDEFYLVKGGKSFSADTSEEDFDVKEEASNAQIRTAFKKFSKNKKLNKVLMTNFGKAVA